MHHVFKTRLLQRESSAARLSAAGAAGSGSGLGSASSCRPAPLLRRGCASSTADAREAGPLQRLAAGADGATRAIRNHFTRFIHCAALGGAARCPSGDSRRSRKNGSAVLNSRRRQWLVVLVLVLMLVLLLVLVLLLLLLLLLQWWRRGGRW